MVNRGLYRWQKVKFNAFMVNFMFKYYIFNVINNLNQIYALNISKN